MAGKSKAQRKKKSQVKKRLSQELQTQVNQRKKKKDEEVAQILATNGAEPEPPKVDEDAGKDIIIEKALKRAAEIGLKRVEEMEIPMETLEENVKRMEVEKAAKEKPFDPSSIVANILKKKEVQNG